MQEKSNPAPHELSDVGGEGFRRQVVTSMHAIQDEICRGLESIEEACGSDQRFIEDLWTREGGGGGRTRVLADGRFLEKGGVNFSEVYGNFSPEFADKIPGSGTAFYATGVSLVLHPENPHVPTVHANFRHIQHGNRAWFGGGADLTPYYFHEEDREEFHAVWRGVCERHPEVADYTHFKDWCDRYFYLPHRREARGVGGIFFDYLWLDEDGDGCDPARRDAVAAFVKDAGHSFLASYLPIVARRRETPYSAEQREWQEIRRGRYAEFNLVHDRGTVFGLKTGGRTESILMSLPPRARWVYSHQVPDGSPEARLLEVLRREPPKAEREER